MNPSWTFWIRWLWRDLLVGVVFALVYLAVAHLVGERLAIAFGLVVVWLQLGRRLDSLETTVAFALMRMHGVGPCRCCEREGCEHDDCNCGGGTRDGEARR